LDEADSCGFLFDGTIHNGKHKASPDTFVLYGGIHGDGSDAGNFGAFVQAIASNRFAVKLGNEAIEFFVGKHPA
jgi:hypothetical protein